MKLIIAGVDLVHDDDDDDGWMDGTVSGISREFFLSMDR